MQRSMANDEKAPLEYTGERMVPEHADWSTFWEHIYRYRFACQYVPGKMVLDIACGEGYGSAALKSAGAVSVVGVDIAPAAVDHAKQRYGIDARLGDATKIPLPDNSVDVVVSFETIEHVDDAGRFLGECKRVMSPRGVLVISTPQRDVYRIGTPNNPYHVSELSEGEFLAILGQHFSKVELFEQRPTRAWWNSRGLRTAAKVARRLLCPDLRRRKDDTTSLILGEDRPLARFVNQYAVTPRRPGSNKSPVYFVAVARG